MYIFLNVYAYTFACSKKNIGPAVYNFAKIIGTSKLYSRHEVLIFKSSSDQYLSSYVVAEILMENLKFCCANEHATWMKGKELKKRGGAKEKKRLFAMYIETYLET